jgi:hypothetical protein
MGHPPRTRPYRIGRTASPPQCGQTAGCGNVARCAARSGSGDEGAAISIRIGPFRVGNTRSLRWRYDLLLEERARSCDGRIIGSSLPGAGRGHGTDTVIVEPGGRRCVRGCHPALTFASTPPRSGWGMPEQPARRSHLRRSMRRRRAATHRGPPGHRPFGLQRAQHPGHLRPAACGRDPLQDCRACGDHRRRQPRRLRCLLHGSGWHHARTAPAAGEHW